MSIFVITGAGIRDGTAHGLPREVMSQLVEHAAMAGKAIAVRGCRTTSEIAGCLHAARDSGAEFILLDPGPCGSTDEHLAPALENLPIPYIEVHDDSFGALEAPIAPRIGHPVNVIQGYGAQSYVLALSIALEHLGCAECENDIHVGI